MQELANMIWGLAQVQIAVTPAFLAACQKRALAVAPHFTCRGVNLALSLRTCCRLPGSAPPHSVDHEGFVSPQFWG